MTDAEWLAAVKAGISGMSAAGTFHDALITQKMNAVRSYMQGAGVTTAMMEDPLGIALVALGVQDLWNLAPGVVTFSPAFNAVLAQLCIRCLPDPPVGVV